MNAPEMIAQFSLLSDAQLFAREKRALGDAEYHVCAGISHRWAVTRVAQAKSIPENYMECVHGHA